MRRFRLIACLAAPLLAAAPAAAQERFMGEVFVTAATFCPRGSLPADGRLLQVSSNQALFALLGATYGGDGRTTYALPDLQGRSPVQVGEDAHGWRVEPGDVIDGALPAPRAAPVTRVIGARSIRPANAYSQEEPREAPGGEAALDVVPADAFPGAGLGLMHCVTTQGIFPSRN